MTKNEFIMNELERLQNILKNCFSKVYVINKGVSSSGLSRKVKFFVIDKKSGKHYNICDIIHNILGYRYDKNENVLTIGGRGMDMISNTLRCINNTAISKGLIKVSKTKNMDFLQCHGLIETEYERV